MPQVYPANYKANTHYSRQNLTVTTDYPKTPPPVQKFSTMPHSV